MALNDRKISTRPDPDRAAREPQHSRGYSSSTGSWNRPAQTEPKKGRTKG